MQWDELDYWQCGEWQVVQERLEAIEAAGKTFNPERQNLFNALDATPFDKVKVVMMGQDPYPDPKYATGLAFSIPSKFQDKAIPSSLITIFQEYCRDLHYPMPPNGNLTKWAERGVLLWNAIPSCLSYKSMSHNWHEWSLLTKEIVQKLNTKGVVFILVGSVARQYESLIDDNSEVIWTSHPSPRGQMSARVPFLGSRIFSTANEKLIYQGLEPIDWLL